MPSAAASLLLKTLNFTGRGNSNIFAPSQTLTDLTGNKTMNWSAGVVAGNWVRNGGSVGGDPGISETAANGSAGTGAVKFFSSATNNVPQLRINTSLGTYLDLMIVCSAYTSGTVRLVDNATTAGANPGGAGTARALIRMSASIASILPGTAPHDYVVDYAEVNSVTPNSVITPASADGTYNYYYTLPVTPVKGTQYWVHGRISDFAVGNYWVAELVYSGTQWDITLYSVTTFTKTSRASATNIGTTNGIRIVFSGTSISLWTTADNGGAWTQRDTTKTNSTYQTAKGVNAMWTSDITAGQIVINP